MRDLEAKHGLYSTEEKELFLRDGEIGTVSCCLEKIEEDMEMLYLSIINKQESIQRTTSMLPLRSRQCFYCY